MTEIIANAILGLLMKKDSELPWVARIARWVLVASGSAWIIGYVVHDFVTWFK